MLAVLDVSVSLSKTHTDKWKDLVSEADVVSILASWEVPAKLWAKGKNLNLTTGLVNNNILLNQRLLKVLHQFLTPC